MFATKIIYTKLSTRDGRWNAVPILVLGRLIFDPASIRNGVSVASEKQIHFGGASVVPAAAALQASRPGQRRAFEIRHRFFYLDKQSYA